MGTNKESWEDFRYQFIETGWFDYDRSKTLAAMRKLWEHIPQDDLDRLPGSLRVFAPPASKLGAAYEEFTPPSEIEQLRAVIYLSPILEGRSQVTVDSTVAHEFAHAVLGHYQTDNPDRRHSPGVHLEKGGDIPYEREADELIARWGFRPAYKSNRKKHRP